MVIETNSFPVKVPVQFHKTFSRISLRFCPVPVQVSAKKCNFWKAICTMKFFKANSYKNMTIIPSSVMQIKKKKFLVE